MSRLEAILEGLTKAHQRELGYLPADKDEPKSLKAALNKIQFAHRQRTVASDKFGRYPNTVFHYYRADSATQPKSLRQCAISYVTVADNTEMLELPCHHVFAVKALFDMLSHGQNAVVESWGCPVCRQGQIKAAHYGDVQFNLKAVSGGAVHDLQNALFWNVCSYDDDDFWDGPATPIPPSGNTTSHTHPRLDEFDEDNMNAFGVAKVVVNDHHTLYMMPHCGCGINEPAFEKWVEATSGDPVCPVSGCGALLNMPRGIEDRLTFNDDGEAVRATPDQVRPIEPTPFPDRFYAKLDEVVISRATGKTSPLGALEGTAIAVV